MKERNLIRGLQQHKPQALEELIQTYSPYVGTIIRNIIGKTLSESDVEELTADVFLAVWEHTDRLKPGKLSPYLATIARNKAKNRIRGYHETVQLEDVLEIGSDENVEDAIDQKLQQELVDRGYAYEDSPLVKQIQFTMESGLKRKLVEEGASL